MSGNSVLDQRQHPVPTMGSPSQAGRPGKGQQWNPDPRGGPWQPQVPSDPAAERLWPYKRVCSLQMSSLHIQGGFYSLSFLWEACQALAGGANSQKLMTRWIKHCFSSFEGLEFPSIPSIQEELDQAYFNLYPSHPLLLVQAAPSVPMEQLFLQQVPVLHSRGTDPSGSTEGIPNSPNPRWLHPKNP